MPLHHAMMAVCMTHFLSNSLRLCQNYRGVANSGLQLPDTQLCVQLCHDLTTLLDPMLWLLLFVCVWHVQGAAGGLGSRSAAEFRVAGQQGCCTARTAHCAGTEGLMMSAASHMGLAANCPCTEGVTTSAARTAKSACTGSLAHKDWRVQQVQCILLGQTELLVMTVKL